MKISEIFDLCNTPSKWVQGKDLLQWSFIVFKALNRVFVRIFEDFDVQKRAFTIFSIFLNKK